MEYMLGGVTTKTKDLVRYLLLQSTEHRIEEVSESVYSCKKLSVAVSREKTRSMSTHKEEEKTVIRVRYPPDRSKCRKVFCRRVETAPLIKVVPSIEECLEAIGCTEKKTRTYKKTVYFYKNCAVSIFAGQDKDTGTALDLVIATVEDELHSEEAHLLEEVKAKLSIWVSLDIPPESTWVYL
ncbi:hypothetical protein NECID01_1286 [Nematocida sp. AWRm77]|nr:hypothetical protein NECID01_1286 [Nematocida sp. AWRm77]